MRRDLAVAFVIVSCSPGGVVAIVREQVAAPGSLVAFAGRSVDGLDPGLRQWRLALARMGRHPRVR